MSLALKIYSAVIRDKCLAAGLLALALSPAARAQIPTNLPVVATPYELPGKAGGVRYYDQHWLPLPGPAGAYGYDVYRHLDSLGLTWQRRRYVVASGQQVLKQYFASAVLLVGLEGQSLEWYETGELREEVTYHKHQLAGTLRTFYRNGRVRRTQANDFGVIACYDSTGRPLLDCAEYYVPARSRGKNVAVAKLPALVQQRYAALLPAGYTAPAAGQAVYYAFRIDSTGAVRDARLLTAAAPPLEKAILQAIAQLPSFEPARLEDQPVDKVVEGKVEVKAGRR